MNKKIYLFHCLYFFRKHFALLLCIFFIFNNLYGQSDAAQKEGEPVSLLEDSLTIDSLLVGIDSLSTEIDTTALATDTLSSAPDSVPPKKKLSPNALESSVKYASQDSIIINLLEKKIYLFEDAKTYYEDIELYAAYMDFGFVNSELYASGEADSCGHIHGPPIFKQGGSEFCSQEIRYNFNTKKGKVTKVITNEGEGFIHGYYVKHVDEKTSYIRDGQYTTCNLPHPHFQIRFTKAKVIQNEKIITGPAYMSFGNIPTPLVIPFGLFPLQQERASGLVIGEFGDGANRGFYFDGFGYYLGINDNFDLLLTGDITTRGIWAVGAKANYVFRYKFNGQLELKYGQTYYGERGTPSRERIDDFRIYWKHNQDPKFHPTTRFSAHINIISSGFNTNTRSSINDYLSNQFNSSLNISTSAGGFFFFDATLTYQQNTSNKTIGLSLPDINMNVRQFYPFRKKIKSGTLKWYDNISLQWRSQMSNNINTVDSMFFKPETWRDIQSVMTHNIPLTVPIKIGRNFNWNTKVDFNEKWYLQSIEQTFSTDSVDGREVSVVNDVFHRGFYALHDVRLSTSITTRLFFIYAMKKGVTALRHTMSPALDFRYTPNLGNTVTGSYFNTILGREVEYSYFPGAGMVNRTQAVASFSINNNLELKVRSRKDTITGTRKFAIFDNLSVSTGYDFAADSLNWEPLRISGRTSLFSFLDVNFSLRFDPYVINSKGRQKETELQMNHRLLRFAESNFQVGLNWHLNQDFFKGKKKKEEPVVEPAITPPDNLFGAPDSRPDFSNPWNITINYTFQVFTKDNLVFYEQLTGKKYESNIVQTINLHADFNITRKWKIKILTGYDIQNKDFSFTQIEVFRDLHCWEMSFRWVPFGARKEWGFKINVKASVLQDLKYDMRRDFRDNLY